MKVIFHADDFGLTAGVNHGIMAAFKNGLLTSTSLISAGEAAEEAVDLALQNPGLDMGIHLVLTDEPSMLSSHSLSTLNIRNGLLPSRKRLLGDLLTHKIDYGEVAAEWRAQVEKPLQRGIKISHMDGHQFIHLFPGLWKISLEIAEQYDIPFVRNTMIEPSPLKGRVSKIGCMRFLQWLGLWGWTKFLAAGGVFARQRALPSVGFLNAGGRLECAHVLKIMDALLFDAHYSCVELFLHPGIQDEHTREKYAHWHYTWENDLNLMLNHTLKSELERRQIRTTSFKEER